MKDLTELFTLPLGYSLIRGHNMIHSAIDNNDFDFCREFRKPKERLIETLLDYKENMDRIHGSKFE